MDTADINNLGSIATIVGTVATVIATFIAHRQARDARRGALAAATEAGNARTSADAAKAAQEAIDRAQKNLRSHRLSSDLSIIREDATRLRARFVNYLGEAGGNNSIFDKREFKEDIVGIDHLIHRVSENQSYYVTQDGNDAATFEADCRATIRDIRRETIGAVLRDVPTHLTFIIKKTKAILNEQQDSMGR